MIIWKENTSGFDFDDDEKYPPILHRQLDKNAGVPSIEEMIRISDTAYWSASFTNFHFDYDLNEQVYKKRKSYFHISDTPYHRIKAKDTHWMTSVAFFAMDVKTCVDFFKIKYSRWPQPPKTAFLHHCANATSMNLFNPDSESDIDKVPFSKVAAKSLNDLYTRGDPHRFWITLEHKEIMGPIYEYRDQRGMFDGIALNFKNSRSGTEDRTEGLCLFQRSTKKMDVMRIAVVDDPLSPSFDPRNYAYLNPGKVISDYLEKN
jgi:hypothetical protein